MGSSRNIKTYLFGNLVSTRIQRILLFLPKTETEVAEDSCGMTGFLGKRSKT